MLIRNASGQKWRVFAFDRTNNEPVTGDAANITAKISKDYGTATALADTNPTETEDGYYLFDLTKAETNASNLAIYPESSTADVQVVGVPGSQSAEALAPAATTAVSGDVPFDLVGGALPETEEVIISSVPVSGAKAGTIQLQLFVGDDYLDANDRALTWVVSIPIGTTIAGSTCTLTFVQASGACDPFEIAIDGTVSTSTDKALLSFDLTSAETSTIPPGEYFWFVAWVGDNDEIITKVFNNQLVQWRKRGV